MLRKSIRCRHSRRNEWLAGRCWCRAAHELVVLDAVPAAVGIEGLQRSACLPAGRLAGR